MDRVSARDIVLDIALDNYLEDGTDLSNPRSLLRSLRASREWVRSADPKLFIRPERQVILAEATLMILEIEAQLAILEKSRG